MISYAFKNLLLLSIFLTGSLAMAADETTALKWNGNVTIDGKVMKSQGEKIKQGATVEAKGEYSFIDMRLGDGSLVRLSNGKVVTTSLAPKKSILTLISGKLYNYIQKAAGQSYAVRTKSAVMGVRGTKFMVSEDDKKTYVCVCEGAVEAKKTDKSENVLIKEYEDLDVLKDKSLNKPKKAAQTMVDTVKSVFQDMGIH
jgi:ferric-dicitrate binding protein FerR (iron transport regulator)